LAAHRCPVFFVANVHPVSNLRTKAPPQTVYCNRFGESNIKSFSTEIKKVRYNIIVQEKKKGYGNWISLEIVSENKKQKVYEGYNANLLWAGDIDGDFKLDILLRVPGPESNVTDELWLSSLSKDNLIHKVSSFIHGGCD